MQASQTISGYWLPRHLVAFRKAHPHIDLHVAIGNTAQVAVAVLAGEVVRAAVQAGLLHSVAFALPDRSFMLLRHQERSLSRAASAFVSALTA